MKWGVRRFQNKDGTLTEAGKKRYDGADVKSTKPKSNHRLKLEDKYRQKGATQEEAEKSANRRIRAEKFVIAAGAITVAAAYAYLTKTGIDIINAENIMIQQSNKNLLKNRDSLRREGILDLNDIPKIKGEHSIDDDAKVINPKYYPGTKELDYIMNCQNCVTAFEMRRRGFDVEASANTNGLMEEAFQTIFENAKLENVRTGKRPIVSAQRATRKWGPEARGKINVYIRNPENNELMGHTFSVFNDRFGNPNFLDTQDRTLKSYENHSMLTNAERIEATRLDNLELTPSALYAVKKRGGYI